VGWVQHHDWAIGVDVIESEKFGENTETHYKFLQELKENDKKRASLDFKKLNC
jgi:hypothetical protein